MLHRIFKHREESWKYDEWRTDFDEVRGVWKFDRKMPRVFDIPSQFKLKLWGKRRNKNVSN